MLIGLLVMRATCGKPRPTGEMQIKAIEKIKITDKVYYHNMSITFDGDNYFTINGGNTDYSVINKYDTKGKFITSYDLSLDGRTIFYNPDDYEMYIKIYGTDLTMINLDDETYDTELSEVFTNEQSSVGFLSENNTIYELGEDGIVKTFDLTTGDEINNYNLDQYSTEDRFNCSIATSDQYIFVWGSTDNEVLIYDLEGTYINKVILPRAGYSFSLSYCNGMLWIAVDADAKEMLGNGYWYGYKLEGLDSDINNIFAF